MPSSYTAIEESIRRAWRVREQMAEEGRLELHPEAAFRIVNGSGDKLPGLAIDRYGTFGFIHVYDAGWKPQLAAIQETLLRLPGIDGVYQTDRTRSPQASPMVEGYAAGTRAPEDSTVVTEAGLQYEIHLASGPAVGLYLDQRENRKSVAAMTAGGSLLNTFSYTCSFSMAAAREGATTVSVDLGKPSLETAKRNFGRNGLALEQHRFLAEDVFVYLPRLGRKGEQFTAVLLDPPTFARGKKGTFSTEKNYAELVAIAAPLVAPGGYLIAFANTHRMSTAAWLSEVNQGLGELAASFKEHARWNQAPDFRAAPDDPSQSYLKSVVLRRS
jgi:23S rRNA (cytosine1962-C5)-methyltransferase